MDEINNATLEDLTGSTMPTPSESEGGAPMFVMIVRLDVKSGCRELFLEAITANAAASVRDEPGCHRFDVCEDTSRPDSFLLYEVYDDASAFDAHRAAPHFAKWREAADKCLVHGSQVNTVTTLLYSGQS
jgi:autoinducer 2-degrading protein